MYVHPLGCCFGADDGLDPDTLALLARRQSAQAGEQTTVTIDSPTEPPPPAATFPWGKILVVTVAGGLVIHYLTKSWR
jgi:hypothetical protein